MKELFFIENFQLSRMIERADFRKTTNRREPHVDDYKIIELYWARKEIAIKETSIKYGGLCTRIAKNILFRLIAIFSQ